MQFTFMFMRWWWRRCGALPPITIRRFSQFLLPYFPAVTQQPGPRTDRRRRYVLNVDTVSEHRKVKERATPEDETVKWDQIKNPIKIFDHSCPGRSTGTSIIRFLDYNERYHIVCETQLEMAM